MVRENDIAVSDSRSWTEYRRLVVKSLKTLDDDVTSLREDLNRIELRFTKDIVALKLQATFYGIVAGVISGGVIQILASRILSR